MVKLRVTPAEGKPFDHPVEANSLVIGRSTKCDVSIPDRFLSRRHARLFREGEDTWLVEDLGSRNGTFVNGRRIEQPEPVRSGDVLTMSASLVKIMGEGENDSTSTDFRFRPASDVLQQTSTPPPAERGAGADELQRFADRLAIINEVHQALSGPITLGELMDLILDRAFEHLKPEHGAVFLRMGDGSFERAAGRSVPSAVGEIAYSERLVDEVANKGMAALVLDARTDDRFAEAHSILGAGVRSLIAAPLLDPKGALGFMVLSSNAAVRQFSDEDLDLLVTLSSVAAMRIRNVALAEEAAERQRLEWELSQARRIQVRLFPQTLPELDGYELYAGNVPSRGVSGDYYEVIERADGSQCVLLVADVSGKGMSASLLTGYLEALASVPIEAGHRPHEVFNRISGPLYRRTPPNRFATVLMAVLQPRSGSLEWANAGHNPGLILRTGGSRDWLQSTGFPLGLVEDAVYHSLETALDPGDLLVLYSDGYTEALNSSTQEYGADRLADACTAVADEPLETIARKLERELDVFCDGRPPSDDRTLVMVRRRGDELG
jgi:serine phosphatase RsbU (regulator of sigma subunit)